jgi:hypothetical protein
MKVSKIDIKNVILCIGNKNFDDVKKSLNEKDVTVKNYNNETEENLNSLYLVVVNKEIEENPDLTDLQRQCNGLIFEKETNKVVAMCQNKMYNISDLASAQTAQRVEYCEDGTMIRLYNYKDNWYTATTRCLDAKKSFWSSNKTFDDMFWEVFDRRFLENLDKNFTYIFTLLHKENRIVVNHKYNNLVYISRINNQTYEEDYKNIFYGFSKNIKRPVAIEEYNLNISKLERFDKRGILFKTYDNEKNTWNVYKYDFEMYKKIKEIRGNVPDIKYRYLELMKEPNSLMMLEQNYPEYMFLFSVIKHSMGKLVHLVHKMYVNSHIKHTIKVEEDSKYYRTLKQLHAQYKTHKKPITFEDVEKKIVNLDKHVLKSYLDWY